MCSADAFAMNPQDAFSGGTPLANFVDPSLMESRFAEMETLIQQTRSLFSHLEMRISHIEGRLRAVEDLVQPESEAESAPSEKVVSFVRVHPYRLALVGCVFTSAVLVGTVLYARESGNRSPTVAQAAGSGIPVRSTSSEAVDIPLQEIRTSGFPTVSHASERAPAASLSASSSSGPGPAEMVYTVVAGDNLTTIALDHGVPLVQILALNPLRNPNLLHVGQKIRIPLKPLQASRVEPGSGGMDNSLPTLRAGRQGPIRLVSRWGPSRLQVPPRGVHVLRRGETLYRLSFRYGVPLDALMAQNPGVNPYLLMVTQRIRIPQSDKLVHRARPAGPRTARANEVPSSRKLTRVAALPILSAPPTLPSATPLVPPSPPVEATDGLTTEVVR